MDSVGRIKLFWISMLRNASEFHENFKFILDCLAMFTPNGIVEDEV